MIIISPSESERNFPTQPDRSTGPRPLGVIGDAATADIGLRCIAHHLKAGDYAAAEGVRLSMGVTWHTIMHIDDRGRAA
jgi:hypothetical protein